MERKLRLCQLLEGEKILALQYGYHLIECTVISNEPYDETFYRSGGYYEDDVEYIEHIHKITVRTIDGKEFSRNYSHDDDELGHTLCGDTHHQLFHITVYANKSEAVSESILHFRNLIQENEKQLKELTHKTEAYKEYLSEIEKKYGKQP